MVLRRVLLSASRNQWIRDAAVSAPVSRDIVRRFVAGETIPDAVGAASELVDRGLTVTIDRLGEDVTEPADAEQTVRDYLDLLDQLDGAGLAPEVEVSVKLSAVGLSLRGGAAIAREHVAEICARAAAVGTTATIDMEDHTTVDATLALVREVREDYPWLGVVLQAYLFRTEADCRELAHDGSRVRLCKGAYNEPPSVAFQRRHDIDLSFVRCTKILMHGQGLPMIATHDPRLIDIARAIAVHAERPRGGYELQMLHGVRPEEQRRLAADGETVRVYLPFGSDWYGYMVRRMAEKPSNAALFVKSLGSKK